MKINFKKSQVVTVDFRKPGVELDFRPLVFVNRHRNTYILVRRGEFQGWFLTMEEGFIDLITMGYGSAKFMDLAPYRCDFAKAIQTLAKSTLTVTGKAQRELDMLLGRETTTEVEVTRPSERLTASETVSLADICVELGIEPGLARRALRGRVEKPGGTWVWKNPDQVREVYEILSQTTK